MQIPEFVLAIFDFLKNRMRYNSNCHRSSSGRVSTETPVSISNETINATNVSCDPQYEENRTTTSNNNIKNDTSNSGDVEDRVEVLFEMMDKMNRRIDGLAKGSSDVKNKIDTM